MALTQEDMEMLTRKLRKMWLRDLLTLFTMEDQGVKRNRTWRLKEMLRDAEADELELTDKIAADLHRKQNPEW